MLSAVMAASLSMVSLATALAVSAMTSRSAKSWGDVEPKTMPSWDSWPDPWKTSAAYESRASWLDDEVGGALGELLLGALLVGLGDGELLGHRLVVGTGPGLGGDRAGLGGLGRRPGRPAPCACAAWAEATRCCASGSAALVRSRLTKARASEAFVPSSCWPSAAIRWSLRFFWSDTESARATSAVPRETEHATTSPAAVSLAAGLLVLQNAS